MTDIKLIVNTEDLPAGIFSGTDITPHSFVIFQPQNDQEIMRLDKEGMIFMGERITDAGEAYAAWMKTMETMVMSKQETIKDARLRDSSSTMLEALLACDEAMEYMSEYDIPITLPEQVKAAIKKATGEE